MAATALLAAIVLAQAPLATVDVAYTELADGREEAAIAKLERADAADPATLINLGAAYARAGHGDKAIAAYRAAIAADDRYDLQLADGSWMDSREAARAALARLMQRGQLTAR